MFKLYIANLQDGVHTQEYIIQPAELSLSDEECFGQDLRIRLEIEKVGRNLFIIAKLTAPLSLICDRCAEPYTGLLDEAYRMLFTSDPDMANDEDESTFLIQDTADEIDLTEPLRETVLLAVPLKRLCRPECLGLCSHCGANLNTEPCSCKTEQTDPRWEKLKSLLNQ